MPNKKFHTFYTRSGIKVAIPLELWNEVEKWNIRLEIRLELEMIW
jgi:hypothetical protein